MYKILKFVKMKKLIFLLFLSLILSCQNSRNSISKPNVILINADDLGWSDLSLMGSKYYETPNIDKLADSGMIFYNAYASAANCAPSRASMLSGKYTTEHHIYTVGNSERGNKKTRKLAAHGNIIVPKEGKTRYTIRKKTNKNALNITNHKYTIYYHLNNSQFSCFYHQDI